MGKILEWFFETNVYSQFSFLKIQTIESENVIIVSSKYNVVIHLKKNRN